MQTHVASGTHLAWGSLRREQPSLPQYVESLRVTARNCQLHSRRHEKTATCRAGRTFTCKILQQASSALSPNQKLKDDLREAAGPLNGLDRTEEQAKHIAKLLKQLESTGQLDDFDLTGSTWRLLYTTSKGSSSGKIGPFIGSVTQVFPEDSRGQYVNKVDFGLVKADLLANYDRPQRDRINVAFEWIRFMLGPLSFKKDISNGTPDTSGGFWRLTYTDQDIRILYTNLGNVFVLVR